MGQLLGVGLGKKRGINIGAVFAVEREPLAKRTSLDFLTSSAIRLEIRICSACKSTSKTSARQFMLTFYRSNPLTFSFDSGLTTSSLMLFEKALCASISDSHTHTSAKHQRVRCGASCG